MGLFGPPNIEKLLAKQDVRRLIEATDNRDPAVKDSAVQALATIGKPATDILSKTLIGPVTSMTFQRSAALLERLDWSPGDDRERLIFALAKENWNTVFEMNDAITHFLPDLVRKASAPLDMRLAGIAILAATGSPTALDLLTEVYQVSPQFLAGPAQKFLVHCPGNEVAPRLRAILEAGAQTEQIRLSSFSHVLSAMGEAGADVLIDLIGNYRTTSSTSAQASYCFSLLALCGTGDPRAAEVVSSRLSGVPRDVRAILKDALSFISGPADQVAVKLGSSNEGVRGIAALLLSNLKEQSTASALAKHLNDPALHVQFASEIALARIGGPIAVQALAEHRLRNQELQERVYGIISLSQIRDPEVIDLLTGATDDKAYSVRAVATVQLRKAGALDRPRS